MPTDIGKDVVDGSTFSQALFNDEEIVKIRKAVIKTEFIKGMVKATLNANHYGGYMVQDAAYCFDAVEVFEAAAKEMKEKGMIEFSEIYQSQSTSLKEYNEEFATTWHLQNAKSIVKGPAAKAYLKFERKVSRECPKFLAIAMLPCHMLWPWIANQLIDFVAEWNPYYKGWFEENKTDPNHKGHLEKFVDYHFVPEEKKAALDIFRMGMIHELNFFREACKESCFDYDFFSKWLKIAFVCVVIFYEFKYVVVL